MNIFQSLLCQLCCILSFAQQISKHIYGGLNQSVVQRMNWLLKSLIFVANLLFINSKKKKEYNNTPVHSSIPPDLGAAYENIRRMERSPLYRKTRNSDPLAQARFQDILAIQIDAHEWSPPVTAEMRKLIRKINVENPVPRKKSIRAFNIACKVVIHQIRAVTE